VSAPNPLLRHVAVMLDKAAKENRAQIWKDASRIISSPASNKVQVNVRRLSRIAMEGTPLFVPGKVLGSGALDRKLVVGAFSFSDGAKTKIEAAGGTALSVEQFLKKYPKGSGVKLVR
jgi:large subunit ribosomal protein L18e